jgi:hypothetical protein
MKIFYVVYHAWNELQVEMLKDFDIVVPAKWARIEIEQKKYEKIKNILKKWHVQEPSVGTIYDKKEIDRANWLMLEGVWINGYPQPEDYKKFISQTYDLSDFCNVCGIGAVQKNPFQLRVQPKWNKNLIFNINWVFDELFVKKDIYETIFHPLGIDFWPVLNVKKLEVITDTVQLKLPNSPIPLMLDSQKHFICKACRRKKFSPQIAGYFPKLKSHPNELSLFKSQEYFGFDSSAFKRIIISNDLLNKFRKFNSKISLAPLLE